MKFLASFLIFVSSQSFAATYLCDAQDDYGPSMIKRQMEISEVPHRVVMYETYAPGNTYTSVYRDESHVAMQRVDLAQCSSANSKLSSVWNFDITCSVQDPYTEIRSIQDHLMLDENTLSGEYILKWGGEVGVSSYRFTLSQCVIK